MGTGNLEELEVHYQLVERDVSPGECATRLHCHCLTVDGNGRVKPSVWPNSCEMPLSIMQFLNFGWIKRG